MGVVKACIKALRMAAAPDAVVLNVLGVLLNACVDEAPRGHIMESHHKATELFVTMMGKQARTQPIAARVTSLVARVAQHGTASEAFRVAGALEQLVPGALGAHGTETQGPAVRALAAMATKDPSTITALREDFGTYFETLGGVIPTLDDTVVGNASMLVSQCATHETNLPLMGFVVEPLVK